MKSFDWAEAFKKQKNTNILTTIKIKGLLTSEAFQKARLCAEKLHGHLPHKFAKPQIHGMLQVAWCDRIEQIRRCFGGETWNIERPVIVFIDNKLIGDDVKFLRHIGKTYAFNLPIDTEYYENLIVQEYEKFMKRLGRKYVYFTFTTDETVIGSFLIMLYTDLVPKTCEHFLKLSTGFRSKNAWGTILCYKNTKVRRIVKDGWIQIGDVLESNDDLDETVLNEITINDESYCIPHDRRGVISLANDGKQSRDQFVVSLKANEWMNSYYVAFGQLIDGAQTLSKIENLPTFYEAPMVETVISECGEYSFDGEKETAEELKEECENYEDTNSLDEKSDRLTDVIDTRDVASLIMFERYEQGLYSLTTDNSPDLQND
ncbi:probable inactive peptidyl-prolyl cis-trans isomerase-like 6 [Venturia canescens]|uniref:probable inactive peptidyl-prolyl cis-trans isomerase-like 6 n=1 Tax=Venturia canescens TaxID=32260 RepID=UPI001C9BF274|nr:probable inactive peptidyl-prolyl cis-trans isomerase-like 6 [Venturia canescens]